MTSAAASAASQTPCAARNRASRTAELSCQACGSCEPARTPARVHGWQRCRHCHEVMVAPWSDWEAFDGPNSRTVVFERRGRSHFVVPRRTLLRSLELAAWLFIVNMITAFCVGAFEIEAPMTGVWRWLGPLGCGLTGMALSALLVRLWNTVQHVEINARQLKRYRTLGRRRYRESCFDLENGIEVMAGEGVETISENRYHVRVCEPETNKVLADLIVPTRREADWLAVLLRRAADPETDAESPRCIGCGAPIGVNLEAHAAGGIECRFCNAGYVVGARELHWPPLIVPAPAIPGDKGLGGQHPRESARVRRRRGRGPKKDLYEWEIRPGPRAPRVFGACGLGVNLLFFFAFGIAMVWISGNTPPGAVGLSLYLLFGACMMFGIAAFALLMALLLLAGSKEIGLDAASLWTTRRLRGLDLARFGKLPDFQGTLLTAAPWRPVSAGLPLLRLIRCEVQREAGVTRLCLATPTRELDIVWRLPPEEDRRLRQEIATQLSERLHALGREVTLRPETG